ncbi:MAG: YebC/PmpR family DNA-binding transcriptional regulator [Phycisphaerae bacterium]
MAGHSHWAGIKYKKARVDAARGKLWSKLARNITVAAKTGGGDPAANPRLRLAVEKARQANMPRDSIERAIKKGTGQLAGEAYEEVIYEGYGPGGVAVMCQALTDNRYRTGPEIKWIFESRGGNLGSAGCVAYLFERKGLLTVAADDADEEQLLEITAEAGADDLRRTGQLYEITCPPESFERVSRALQDAEIKTQLAEISMVPKTVVPIDADVGKKVLDLIEQLQDHDDVQNVYSNFEVPDAVMAQLAEQQ